MTRAARGNEARAWRECAEWCDRNRKAASNGLCVLLSWTCGGWKSDVVLPSHWPHGKMLRRVERHARRNTTGCYLDSLWPERRPLRHSRVIFCLLMALECEDEALPPADGDTGDRNE